MPKPSDTLQLVGTFPVGTTFDASSLPRTHEVWLEMIDLATSSIDVAQFYLVDAPGRRLEPILAAIRRAAQRGVAVRLLVDETFANRYGETIGWLADNVPDIQIRPMPWGEHTGGILHAKYFLVDRREAYLGSQNFDWRSLEHIVELGVRISEPAIVDAVSELFDADWALAAPGGQFEMQFQPSRRRFPVELRYKDELVNATPLFSPHEWLPDHDLWDLPPMLTAISTAEKSIHVQVMSYDVGGASDEDEWEVLDEALIAAAGRGVQVVLVVGDWVKQRPDEKSWASLHALSRLNLLPNITVRMVSIPEAPEGHIDFARVIHSKFMVIDGRWSWLGTSNWSRDYFFASRNVGIAVVGGSFAADLEQLFLLVAQSEYATELIPRELREIPAKIEALARAGSLPIVVFDLDSTLFSTDQRNRKILEEFSARVADEYAELPELLKELEGQHLPWNTEELLQREKWADEDFLNEWREFWRQRFFENSYVSVDSPSPGAVEFVKACHNRGALIYYLSGRHHGAVDEGMDLGTVESLVNHGFPHATGRTILHFKEKPEQDDEAFKNDALTQLRRLGGEVIATFENEPANANLFVREFPEAMHFWLQTVWSPKAVLPDRRLIKIDTFFHEGYPAKPAEVPKDASVEASE